MDQRNLNIRQRRWLDVMKDNDCETRYPGKANVVADVLSRKVVSASIMDLSMRMTVVTLILEMIRDS